MRVYSEEELQEALRSMDSTLSKCVKVLGKLPPGSSQHTLLVRRIRSFEIAMALMEREYEQVAGKEISS